METWKLYGHLEDDSIEFTTILQTDPSDKAESLAKQFAVAFEKVTGKKINESDIELETEKGKKILKTESVAKKLVPKADVIIKINNKKTFQFEKKQAEEVKKPERSREEILQEVEQLKLKGNNFIQQKRYRDAIDAYSAAINLISTNSLLYSNRSQAYLSINKFEDALQDAKMAIKLDNKHAKSYFRAGKASFELRKYKDAEKYFSEGKYITKLEMKDKAGQALQKEFEKWITKSEEAKKSQNSDRKPGQRVIKGLPGGNISANLPGNMTQQQLIEEYQRKIELIKQRFSEGKLRETKSICEEILSVVPGEKLSSHYLSTILNSARNFKKSVEVLEKAVKEHEKEFELKFSLGEAYFGNGDFTKALDVFKGLFDLLPSSDAQHSNPDYVRLSIRVSRCLIQLNQYDIALTIVTDLLKHNDTNPEALLEYGKILLKKEIKGEAIKVFLRALITKSDDKQIKRNLALAVSSPGGLNALREELQDAKSASALAYLALIFKDAGAVKESAQLFKEAAAQAPANPTYILNYIHVLEILTEYSSAFESVRSFLSSNPRFFLPSYDGNEKITAGEISEILKEIEGKVDSDLIERGKTGNEGSNKMGKIFEKTDLTEASNLDSEQLDILAILYTIIKILFIHGKSFPIQKKLADKIEKIRKGKELHKTTIRNENAYYCCITQLYEFISYPLPSHKPLFVFGDSHCLPTAWQTLNIQNEPRLLVPKLVTGCKIWHLRPESYFFPKVNFYNVLATIPNNSEVIVLFGEIDCREGILVAVERCYYENDEEGINVNIDIYVKILNQIVTEKNLTIYVHPVIPVLDITRPMVKKFNRVFEEKVKKESKLHWLDIFPQLLTEDAEKLLPEYELDGTHMNPCYLSLVEQAINSHKQS